MKNIVGISVLFVILNIIASVAFGQSDEQEITYNQVMLDNGLITLAVPETWEIDLESVTTQSIGMASNLEILERDASTPLIEDQATVLLNFVDATSASENEYIVGDTLAEKLAFVMNELVENVVDEDGESLIQAQTVELIEGTTQTSEYAQVEYTFQDFNATILMWNLADGLLGMALIQSAEESLEQNMEIAITIVQSVRYLGEDYAPIIREAQS